jgi:hypothetical protein
MWTNGQFWLDSTWRAFRTFCQTLAALLAGQAATIITADWKSTLSVSVTAALISLLQSIDRERVVAAESSTIAVVDNGHADPYASEGVVEHGHGGSLR